MRVEKAYRGISVRLAVHYLEGLGGDRITGEGYATEADHDDDPYLPAAVEADDWRATLDANEASVGGGSLTLHEVSVVFEGDEETVEPLVEQFSQKAVRAGG